MLPSRAAGLTPRPAAVFRAAVQAAAAGGALPTDGSRACCGHGRGPRRRPAARASTAAAWPSSLPAGSGGVQPGRSARCRQADTQPAHRAPERYSHKPQRPHRSSNKADTNCQALAREPTTERHGQTITRSGGSPNLCGARDAGHDQARPPDQGVRCGRPCRRGRSGRRDVARQRRFGDALAARA